MAPPAASSLPTRVRRRLVGHKGAIFTARLNAKGEYCMTGGQDKTVRLWNPFRSDPNELKNGLLIQTYAGVHSYEIRDVAITPDNSRFASVGGDRAFFLWDVGTARVIRRLPAHDHNPGFDQKINSVAFNQDGTVVLTGSDDRTLKAWDLRSNNRDPIQTLADSKDSVTRVVATEDAILATSLDGCLRTYDLRKGVVDVDDCHEALSSLCISYDGKCVLMNGLDGVIRLLERATGEMLNSYKGHTQKERAVESRFDNTDAFVFSGSEDGRLHVYDLVEGTTVASVKEHSRALCSLAYHPTQPSLVTAGYDGHALVWSNRGDD